MLSSLAACSIALVTSAFGQFVFDEPTTSRTTTGSWKTDVARTISVSGTATTYAKPDYASIVVTAFRKAPTAVGAKRACDTAMAKAVNAIRKLGISANDIETTNYSIFPYRDKETAPLQWKVQQSASIRIRKVGLVADVIDVAVLNGAPSISNIDFGLESVGQYRTRVRADAMKVAREKAEALAKLAGVSLGDVVNISESGADGAMYSNTLSRFSGEAKEASISAGQQEVSLTVNVTYAIK